MWTRSIYGTVTGPGGVPLVAEVSARPLKRLKRLISKNRDWLWPTDDEGYFNTRTWDGAYELTHLPAGKYEVFFISRIEDPDRRIPRIVDLREQTRVRLDVHLRAAPIDGPSGRIAGRVTIDSGEPASACVIASPYEDGSGHVARTYTRSDGRYEFRVAVGEYRLIFRDCDLDDVMWPHYYGATNSILPTETREQAGYRTATPVAVSRGATTDADVVMESAPAVTGRVLDSDGQPLRGICVALVSDEFVAGTPTYADEDGIYALGPVERRRYTVQFVDAHDEEDGSSMCYWQERWRLEPALYPGYDQEPRFFNAGGGSVTLDDVELRSRPIIRGRVTDSAGQPVRDACIESFSPGAEFRSENTFTWPDGTYQLWASQGQRQIAFSGLCDEGTPDLWYPQARSREDATTLSLERDVHYQDINARF